RLESNPNLENIVEWSKEVKEYLYEIPQSVDYADLINELFHAVGGTLWMLLREKRRTIATSNEEVKSEYFKRRYIVRKVLSFHPVKINDFLKKEKYGRVTLKISIPDKDYWKFRKRIEQGLSGEKRAYLFKFKDKAIIAEPLD
ncbi:MAG TPA: methyltransferase, partial [Thermococcus litoralis]|nr:methyltransferase [Thermococcus litoralis]